MSRIGSVALLGAFLTHPDAIAHPNSTAQSIDGIRVTTQRPLAPRGGVMLLTLQQERSGNWPRTIPLHFADGRTAEGHLAWVTAGSSGENRHWTSDPRNLLIHDAPQQHATGRAVLLAHLPEDGEGPIRLGTHTLEPIWRDVPAVGNGQRRLERRRAPDRPGPDAPLEYWRWVLLADRLGQSAPPPPGEHEPARLVAEHFASAWLIGLERVRRTNPNLAATLLHALTSISDDNGRPFATWITNPAATNRLLAELNNTQRSRDELMRFVQDWLDEHHRIILWSEDADTEQVRLAMVNPREAATVATLSWIGSDEYAIGVELLPRTLNRIKLDRAAIAPRNGPFERSRARALRRTEHSMPATEHLAVETDRHSYQISFDRRVHRVAPPGVSLPPFHPTLSLYAAQTGHMPEIAPQRATITQVRRLRGRWELFVECRRPAQPARVPEPEDDAIENQQAIPSVGDLEGVTVFIGSDTEDDEHDVVLLVPESGWYRLLEGANDGTLQVHRSSRDDRWTARIVLPDAWMATHPGDITRIGMLRHHHDLEDVHSSPFVITPWRAEPGRIHLDLSMWRDLPRPADANRHEQE